MKIRSIYIYICFKKTWKTRLRDVTERRERERERVNLILETSTTKTVDPDAVDTVHRCCKNNDKDERNGMAII